MKIATTRSRSLAFAAITIAVTTTAFAAHADRAKGMMDARFDEIDADGDDIVTIAELETHRMAMFAEADADSDGVLAKEELMALMQERGSRVRGKRGDVSEDRLNRWVERAIERRDSDENGSLSFAELHNERSERMMEYLDSDEDGQLTKAEFEARSKRRHRGWWSRWRD